MPYRISSIHQKKCTCHLIAAQNVWNGVLVYSHNKLHLGIADKDVNPIAYNIGRFSEFDRRYPQKTFVILCQYQVADMVSNKWFLWGFYIKMPQRSYITNLFKKFGFYRCIVLQKIL